MLGLRGSELRRYFTGLIIPTHPQHIRPVLRSGIVFRLVELSGVSLLLSIAFSSLRSSSHRSVLKAFSCEAAIRLHRRYLSRTL